MRDSHYEECEDQHDKKHCICDELEQVLKNISDDSLIDFKLHEEHGNQSDQH